jgi:hypothetical protein
MRIRLPLLISLLFLGQQTVPNAIVNPTNLGLDQLSPQTLGLGAGLICPTPPNNAG